VQPVRAIYHCATSMNHLETYAMAKAANVDGTREVLALATSGSLKQVNFISSLGIFSGGGADQPRIVSELTAIDDERHWHSQGYVASKWVGEKVIALADARGIPCNIFRLGLVWGDSEQGRYDPLQHGYRMLKSCMLSGCGIQGYRYGMLPIPVDYATRAMLFLATRHCDGHGVFHIASQQPMTEGVFERYNRVARVPLRLLPFYDWICEIKRLHQEGRALPVVPLIEYAFTMNEKTFYEHEARRNTLAPQIDCARTHQELEPAGIVVPGFGDSFLGICVANMISTDVEIKDLFRL
jgi:myxalamid-type nonribosomal peptide synthetase MxaA